MNEENYKLKEPGLLFCNSIGYYWCLILTGITNCK